MPEKLKKGWCIWRFDQMAVMVNDRIDNPAESDVEHYIGLEHLDSDSLTISRWGTPSDVEATKLRFRKGDIIFGRRRVYQRKLAVAQFDGICSAHAMVLRAKPEVALPEFLPFFLQSDLFMERAKQISVGSLSPTINWKTLAQEEFALPPLEEQRRIADTLRVHVEARESLRVALGQADVLRKSFLWNYFPFSSESRTVVTLGSLVDGGEVKFQTGPFGTVLSASEYRQTGWPIVNPTDMRNGEICHEGGPCVDDATAKRLEKYRLCGGDILLARKGDFSKAVLAREQHMGWIGGSDTIRLRCASERLSPSYLYLCIQAPDAERMLYSYAHGTVMPGLNEKMLGRLVIDLRNVAEQEVVVKYLRRVESAEKELRARDSAYDASLKCILNEIFSHQECVL